MYLGELLEIQHDQIRDVEIPPFGHASSFEKDMCDAITDFQPAIACETIIERDPTKGELFGRSRSLEVFIQNIGNHVIRAYPTNARHFERRCIRVVMCPVHKIHIDLHKRQRGSWTSRM